MVGWRNNEEAGVPGAEWVSGAGGGGERRSCGQEAMAARTSSPRSRLESDYNTVSAVQMRKLRPKTTYLGIKVDLTPKAGSSP